MPTPGLTVGRVSGEKTLCQRCCEDGIADRPSALARWVFRAKKRSRNSDLGVAQARQAGGFYAGQVAWLRARSSEFFWALMGTYRNL